MADCLENYLCAGQLGKEPAKPACNWWVLGAEWLLPGNGSTRAARIGQRKTGQAGLDTQRKEVNRSRRDGRKYSPPPVVEDTQI